MANTRSKKGNTKQREFEKIFYDDTQEERTSATTASSKNRLGGTKKTASTQQPEIVHLKQETTTKEQMHTFSETGAGVPAFLAKLWRLVDDPDTNHLICWNKDGRSFIIQNQAQFARELLPLNYKHNNMASFIRQLNMYGFHKITSIDNGGLKFDRDEMEFSHPCFKRNCPFLLEHIKRKIANTKSIDDKSGLKPEAVTKVLQDVKAMRGRQDSLDSRFSVMKQENEALWREIASLRQKHAKQQQIVNKLIQFLITIVQPSRNMTSVKRHMQLMIHDTPENAKLRKKSESESECGPVIHELGEELLDEVTDAEVDLMEAASPYGKMTPRNDAESCGSPLNIERPHSSISQMSQQFDYSNQSAEDAVNAALGSDINEGLNLGGSDAASKNSQKLGTGTNSSIIQSVNPDGSHIFYHVTEVPDAIDSHHNDVMPSASPNYSEENVLTTPMVREQMARSQQLKERNKRRRKQAGIEEPSPDIASKSATANVSSKCPSPKLIKSENTTIDPMSFLNVFTEDQLMQPDTQKNSPIPKEDSHPSNGSNSGLPRAGNTAIAAVSTVGAANDVTLLGGGSQAANFYNPSEFITPEMPADIFEESPLISAEPNSYNQQQQQQQKEPRQQQFGRTMANSGKFSSFVTRNNNNGNVAAGSPNGASTSAAAAAAASNQFYNSDKQSNNCNALVSSQQGKNVNNNGSNLLLAKYKNGPGSEDMRDDVNNHLDNVQDELESLKDLLRSDGYSLDANTLLSNGDATNTSPNNRISFSSQLDGEFLTKLFNDSDILGPFGLSLINEVNTDKKGSELMSYQPMYDLSDIIDINDKNELEAVDQSSRPSSSRQLQQLQQQQREPLSGLNTPYNDYFANALEPSSTPKKSEPAAIGNITTKP
ncbi:heat shock factor protein isoform X1 [Anastrepha ludens]|uniref:heat shock factor protein isoform X1 n=3 Tax=Anastrepha ludens TaxID=28586 RepID=UPI0023B0D434|nr:heat shock factor protein isoform X1 [Anastrepha ludens]XP_053967093.1 heat shock factor protein isoform X1 [Anastrepha ludens]XP_053967094.1 heat shock factor protein isoform X1 [Anastrepha ludens]XP_053967095.1 heat shock factor protein isoform X1 [Anastrepha ludens]